MEKSKQFLAPINKAVNVENPVVKGQCEVELATVISFVPSYEVVATNCDVRDVNDEKESSLVEVKSPEAKTYEHQNYGQKAYISMDLVEWIYINIGTWIPTMYSV